MACSASGKTPKISIITVCYNSARTIEQTIQSVISQGYAPLEYIIIDGGSTDGTLAIIKKYAEHITKYISEPDGGIFDAMNKGIRLAAGDIIGMINSDDWYADGALYCVSSFFVVHPWVKMIHGDIVLVYADGNERYLKGTPTQEETLLTWYDHPTVFVRHEVYEKYGLYNLNYPILADVELMLRLRCQKIAVGYIPKSLAYFRIGGISSDNNSHWRRLRELKHVIDDLQSTGTLGYTDDKTVCAALREKRYQMIIRYLLWRMQKHGIWLSFLWEQVVLRRKCGYALWGTGDDAAAISEDFKDGEQFINFFIDSNPVKHGSVFYGKVVKQPTIDLHDQLVIVATRRYGVEVQKVLEGKGYQRYRDFLLPDDFYGAIWKRYVALGRCDLHGDSTHSYGQQ